MTSSVLVSLQSPTSLSQAGFGNDEEVVLTNSAGVQVHIITTGAVVQRLLIPDRSGSFADVVLGFDELQPYKVPALPQSLGQSQADP